VSDSLKRIAWSFGEGFLAGLALTIPVTAVIDCGTQARTLVVWGGSILVASVTAGAAAVKNAVFTDGSRWR
jgi:hypothetical protein